MFVDIRLQKNFELKKKKKREYSYLGSEWDGLGQRC